MKKIITSLVAIAASFSFAFADGLELSFSNKVYEEDTILTHTDKEYSDDGEDSTTSDFPGLKDSMSVEVTSERVDAAISAIVTIDDYDEKHFGIQGEVDDWFIEFRPIHPVTLGMHTGIFADGSYLPVYDDNLEGGNIGSEGFTVTYRPSVLKDALRLSFSAPFDFSGETDKESVNWFNGKEEDGEEEDFDFRVGAIYSQDYLNLGFAVQDAADSDERQVGVYVALPTLFGMSEGLTIGGGFTQSEKENCAFDDLISSFGLGYEQLFNAFLTYESEAFSLSAEALYNFGEKYVTDTTAEEVVVVDYDFYSAVAVSFKLGEKLTATATGKVLMDLEKSGDEAKENVYGTAFALDYDLNENNTIGAEFDFNTFDGNWDIAVPVYWEYHF